jgi:cobyrinic acid a,c-diamide synthase
MVALPRIVIAAPASGHGKTSVTTGLLRALRDRGLRVSGHKVGPDYIDPSYHALAAGRPGRNLDSWLVGKNRIQALFLHGASTPVPADVAVIEGVMGLFDGVVDRGRSGSTAEVATLLDAPVLLVVDAGGMGRSIAALAVGYAGMEPDLRLAGVILNRVGSARHEQILRTALAEVGMPVLGVIPRLAELTTPSRHLGLIPAAERSAEAERTVAALAGVVSRSVDLDLLLRVARGAPDLLPGPGVESSTAPTTRAGPPVRIGIAGGAAFTFGYQEQQELLIAAGAEPVRFDPLTDERLPAGLAGIVIGGGFPETYCADLSANDRMRTDIADRVRAGVPIAAECAGLLYLMASLDGMPMCSVLDGTAAMSDRLTLGYRDALAAHDSVLLPAGSRVHGHEFHRTVAKPIAGRRPAWRWQTDPQAEPVEEGHVRGNIHASYLHLHWAGAPDIANRFVAACRQVQQAEPAGR